MIHDDVHEHTETVQRCATKFGELVLRRRGEHFELINDGVFLMDTRDGRSERALIDEVLAVAPRRPRVVIGGLGFGFSLDAAVASAIPSRIDVVEIHRQVIEWNQVHLPERAQRARADPRVRIVHANITEWLGRDDEPLDVLCLDTDNGPDWLAAPGNAALYADTGLTRIARRLAPAGVLGVWSAGQSAEFEHALRGAFGSVVVHEIPVERGEPDVVFVARHPRVDAV